MRQKILIVEDDRDCRELIVIQLRALHYTTIEAESGAKGFQRAISETPDLIIMDLGLLGVSGIEAMLWLKEDPRTKHIPIIVYIAWREEGSKKKLSQLGAAKVLTKPVSTAELHELVQGLLEVSLQTWL